MIEKEIDENGPGEFDNVKLRQIPVRGKLTFFYEKQDGLIFAAEEQEAATGKYRSKFRFVGWSDGNTYLNTIRAAKLKKNQHIPKEEAEKLLKEAFDAELKVAKKNLRTAIKDGTRIPRPERIEWTFDASVPERDRYNIAGGKYKQANSNNE